MSADSAASADPWERPLRSREQAIARALSIAEGRYSAHHNVMLEMEAGSESRVETLARITEADSAHAQMFVALAAVLPTEAELAAEARMAESLARGGKFVDDLYSDRDGLAPGPIVHEADRPGWRSFRRRGFR